MDFNLICRTCLGVDNLSPIFKDSKSHDKFTISINKATGVQVNFDDNLPQNMCTVCTHKLNEVLKFRKLCRESEIILLTQINKNNSKRPKKSTKKEKLQKTRLKILAKSKSISTNGTFNTDFIDITDIINKKTSKNAYTDINDSNSTKYIDYEDNVPLNVLLPNNTVNVEQIEPINNVDRPLETGKSHQKTNNNLPTNLKVKRHITDYCETVFELSDTEKYSNESDDDIDTDRLKVHADNKNISINTDPQEPILDSEGQNASHVVYNIKNTTENWNTEYLYTPYEPILDSDGLKVIRVLCKLCNKELSIRSIDFHMSRYHPGADERKVKCDLCDSYVLKNKLNRHMKLMHKGCFNCGYCKLDFESKEQLKLHSGNCTSKKRKRITARELIECDQCHKVMQKASLGLHKRVQHAGQKPVCEHCGKSFGNNFRLHEHYRAKHGYEKFQCKYCDFRSATSMAMRNHERRHLGEKPYICEECGTKFHAAYLLAQHKHSHRTEKLVKCDLCPASFKSNNSLHTHKFNCHSIVNYKCMICNRSYKCRHYTVKHIRHVHKYSGPSPPISVVKQGDMVGKETVEKGA